MYGGVVAGSFPAAPILVCRAGAFVGAWRCLRSAMFSGIELPAGVSQLGVHTASASGERLVFIAQATASGKRVQRFWSRMRMPMAVVSNAFVTLGLLG